MRTHELIKVAYAQRAALAMEHINRGGYDENRCHKEALSGEGLHGADTQQDSHVPRALAAGAAKDAKRSVALVSAGPGENRDAHAHVYGRRARRDCGD